MPSDLPRDIAAARIINAAGTLTRLSGARVSPRVAAAMAEAAQLSFDMWALQAAASERLSAALAAAGVAVRYLKFAGRNHADTVAALSVPARRRAPVLEEVRRFVRERSGPSR